MKASYECFVGNEGMGQKSFLKARKNPLSLPAISKTWGENVLLLCPVSFELKSKLLKGGYIGII